MYVNFKTTVTINVLKFLTFFSFRSQMKCWGLNVEIHKMLVRTQRTANREDPDQTASSEAV